MTSSAGDRSWWTDSVVYQIYPRSFASTPGSGTGDLDGIRARLDHLVWLGVDALWLSPVFRSPMADFGYDVSDFCDIDPTFGDLDGLDRLVAEAHDRGLRILLDWVPNHTSIEHPWFVASRSSRSDPKRDWYVWRDPDPDGDPPNNWIASLVHQPAWTFDEPTGQYYLHSFLAEQPDLDWSNPEVEAAMHDVLRFWLDRGIDGFRADVVHLIGKDPALPDEPPELVGLPHVILNDRAETHVLLRRLRALLDAYPGDRMMVGEVYLLDTDAVATYYGDHDELHLSFNFPPLQTAWRANRWRSQIEKTTAAFDPIGAWPTWVLSNHDVVRHASRYGSEARARAAAVLLLTLRGTPFLYAGEELGLLDAEIPADRVVDPGGRDGCRAPIPWTPAPDHGWGTEEPWLPWPPHADTGDVESQRADPKSILHLYRRLLAHRRDSPALISGDLVLLEAPDGVVAFARGHPADQRIVLINFTHDEVVVGGALAGPTGPVPTIGVVAVASDAVGEGLPFDGVLAPNQAVVIDARVVDGR